MRAPRGKAETKPCENCGTAVTMMPSAAKMRRYWSCGAKCAAQLRQRNGNMAPSWTGRLWLGQQETRPCVECGTPATHYLSHRAKAQAWTCSMRCQGLYTGRRRVAEGTWVQPVKPRRGVTEPCPVCETPVYRSKGQVERGIHKYCSVACANVAHTKPPVVKACAICGKEMRLKPSQAMRQHCSQPCHGLGRTKNRLIGHDHNGKPARVNKQGYVLIWEPGHGWSGWVLEHRWVVSQALGRPLTSDEQVDHVNRDKTDNRLENLQVMNAHDHTVKTMADVRADREQVQRDLAELAAYRARFGPLPKED